MYATLQASRSHLAGLALAPANEQRRGLAGARPQQSSAGWCSLPTDEAGPMQGRAAQPQTELHAAHEAA